MICYFLLNAYKRVQQLMVGRLIIYLALVCVVKSYFCFSQCATPVNGSCNGSPYNCNVFDPLFLSLDTFNTGFSKVEMARATAITPANNFKLTTTFAPSNCSIIYNTTTNFTYVYDIVGKFVSTDYIYKQYAIIKPHYQIRFRLSIAFVGVWASTDYLNLYTYDGVIETNFPMRYTCTDASVNYTEMLCNTRSGNNVDCVISYSFTLTHNSTYLLFNLSSLTNIKDSNIQYWSILDLNIATVDCDIACTSCFGNLPSMCTACDQLNYLDGNSCATSCSGTLLKLPNVNPLLGGFCVASCPPGYFVSGTTCSTCGSGCLSCTSATSCLLTAKSASTTSSFQRLLPLWVVLIILLTLAIIGLIWKCLFDKSAPERQRVERMVSQSNERNDQKVTVQQREQNLHQTTMEKNVHIEQIDFNDHIKVDTNPRKRKRQERDMNRSNMPIIF